MIIQYNEYTPLILVHFAEHDLLLIIGLPHKLPCCVPSVKTVTDEHRPNGERGGVWDTHARVVRPYSGRGYYLQSGFVRKQ